VAYYKYMRLDRFTSLRRRRIRFTQPGAFNDPFEMPAFKAAEAEAGLRGFAGLSQQTREILAGLTRGEIPPAASRLPIDYWFAPPPPQRPVPPVPDVRSTAAIERIRDIDREFGILSLSMTADNLLLWAHYADEHRGLAVEIDPDESEFRTQAPSDHDFQLARSVRYSAQRPLIPETDDILFEHFFVKSLEWEYEQEYRIVRKLASSVETVRPTAPYPVHLYDLPPNAIRKVIFGVRAPDDQRAILMKETSAEQALAHVTFAEAVLDPKRFQIDIRSLAPRGTP
jgi:DUF2971 family protein